MPKFLIEMNDGRKFNVESDRQPSESEVMNYLSQSSSQKIARPQEQAQTSQKAQPLQEDESLGISKGKLTSQERFSGGFRTKEDLENRREIQRQKLNLAIDTPIEPTGFNIQNIQDLPFDILDAIGPMFPTIGQLGGGAIAAAAATPETLGIATIPALIAGGTVGGAAGEAARQFIGEKVFGFDQGTFGQRAKRIGVEGALAMAGELTAGGINALNLATKKGMVKAFDNLIKNKGLENATAVFAKIFPNVEPTDTIRALDYLKKGDKRVLNKVIGEENYIHRISKSVMFGHELGLNNITKNIAKNASFSSDREGLYTMYDMAGIPKDAIDTIIENKGIIPPYIKNDNFVLGLAKKVSSGIKELYNKYGEEVKRARVKIYEEAPKAGPIDITSVNNALGEALSKPGGILKKIGEGFSFNDEYAFTGSGKKQVSMFKNIINDFFDKKIAPIQIDDIEILKQLANTRRTKGGTNILYIPKNNIKPEKLISSLNRIEKQITESDFSTLGELSPFYTMYKKELNEKLVSLGDKLGRNELRIANKKYSQLFEYTGFMKGVAKENKLAQAENFLKSLSNKDPAQSLLLGANRLEDELSLFHRGYRKHLNLYNAYQGIKHLNNESEIFSAVDKMVKLINRSTKDVTAKDYLSVIDRSLGGKYNLVEEAIIHKIAKSLNQSSFSLLRARFAGNALQVGTLFSALGIGAAVAPLQTAAVLGAGTALQSKTLLKRLLKIVAKQTSKKIPSVINKNLLPSYAGTAISGAGRFAEQNQ